jgi:hypothetical protein
VCIYISVHALDHFHPLLLFYSRKHHQTKHGIRATTTMTTTTTAYNASK